MVDKEKIIRGLECCLGKGQKRGMCEDCPYDTGRMKCNLGDMHVDALALLKAQEPRLVTEYDFEGADEYGWLPAWCEEQTGAVYCECILADALKMNGIRYWTSRPSDEVRRATPWTQTNGL